MSIGNLKDNGNKGSNVPYQMAVLQLLQGIIDASGGSPAPTSVTPSLTRVTSAVGSPIAAGAKSVSVYNAGAANGLVLGAIIKPGESLTWSADSGSILTAVSYDGTGTELVITKVV